MIEWRNEGKDQGKGRPRFPILKDSRETPSDKPFIGEKCGLFRQERTDTTRNSSEPLPKIIGIDPGQKNVWSACLYNSKIPSKRSECNGGIGLFRLRTWQKQIVYIYIYI